MIDIQYNKGTEAYVIVIDGIACGYARFSKDILWFTPPIAISFTSEDVSIIAKELKKIKKVK